MLTILGIEVFYQVALQIVLLLLTQTMTATVGGLETFFQQDKMFGIRMSPSVIITLSVIISLKTSIFLHIKIISLEKGFFGFKAKVAVFLWGLVSTIRRVLGIVSFFIPSLGLLNLLWHWHSEQFSWQARVDYAKKFNITPSPYDKIDLYDMREEVLWSDLDRWSYEDPHEPRGPPYSIYTGLCAKLTLAAFLTIIILHGLTIFLVKFFTSYEFRNEKGNVFTKIIHVISNTNIPSPYKDWDIGHHSVEEHKRRYKRTEREMKYMFLVNTVFSLLLLAPLWFTGYNFKCWILKK